MRLKARHAKVHISEYLYTIYLFKNDSPQVLRMTFDYQNQMDSYFEICIW